MTPPIAPRGTTTPWVVIEHNHAAGEPWLSIGYTDQNGMVWGPIADIVRKTDFYTPVAELKYLATSPDEQRANAALIVKAVNAHAPLVAALADLLHTNGHLSNCRPSGDPELGFFCSAGCRQARAALALARDGVAP